MSTPEITLHSTSETAPCCCSPAETKVKSTSQNVKTIETASRIALGIFAAYIAPQLFGIAFAIGVGVGLAYTLYGRVKSESNSRPACAQGFMEYLAGTKFPVEIVQIVTAIFIAQHIHHAPNFYVPFCGVFLGFWTVRQAIANESASPALTAV